MFDKNSKPENLKCVRCGCGKVHHSQSNGCDGKPRCKCRTTETRFFSSSNPRKTRMADKLAAQARRNGEVTYAGR
jgi:hypothetical protein